MTAEARRSRISTTTGTWILRWSANAARTHCSGTNHNGAGWLRVRLIGPNGQAGAYGTKVYVYDSRHVDDPNHLRGFREARGATGYCSQNDSELHFGVPAGQAYEIKAVFPNGTFFIAKGVEAPARIVIDPNAPLAP